MMSLLRRHTELGLTLREPDPISFRRATGFNRLQVGAFFDILLSEKETYRLHLTETLGSCSRSLYAVRILKAHGLPTSSLHEVTRATVLARLLYAPLHGVASPQPRIAPELTVSSIELLI